MQSQSTVRSWTLRDHLLMVANAALACRVATLLYFYLAGQSWRITLALALLVAASSPARAGSFTFAFDGLADGDPITNLWEGDWELAAAPNAAAIAAGNPYYAGSPGALFGGLWEITHSGATVLEAVSIDLAPAGDSPAAADVAGQAVYHDPLIELGPGWTWSVSAADVYSEDLGGYRGDTIVLGPTGPGWQVLSVTFEYGGADPASVPEPPSGALAGLGLAGLASGVRRRRRRRRGLTLIELLVVLVIIVLISVVALPTVLPALNHRQSSEAGRILQGALVGARDKAIHDGEPSGIRLIPDPAWPIVRLANGQVDPAQPLACSRILPIGPAPQYSEGAVTVRAGAAYVAAIHAPDGDPQGTGTVLPSLVLEQAPADGNGAPNAPTSWAWNVRVGDRLQLNNAGPWYTVVGPMWVGPAAGNSELFVNWGSPGTTSPLNPTGKAPVEWLVLTDGRDDNGNGVVDDGWDGVDNNGDGQVDEYGEWLPNQGYPVPPGSTPTPGETEAWQGAASAGMTSVPYTIRRRPAPLAGAREISLPTQVVIDLTTWATTLERSRLPVNPWTGEVELLINPDGTVVPTTVYSSPASSGLAAASYHFWLSERTDVAAPDPTMKGAPTLPLPALEGAATATIAMPTRRLEGTYGLLTLHGRSGRTSVDAQMPFFYDAPQAGNPNYQPAGWNNAGLGVYSPSNPFMRAEQGQ